MSVFKKMPVLIFCEALKNVRDSIAAFRPSLARRADSASLLFYPP
jgi:hypothetical protein